MSTANFSVIIFTAPPPGLGLEADGSFVKVDGRETLLRTVELFLNRDNIQQITVVFPPSKLEEAKTKFGGHFGFSGVKIAAGGPRWIDQVAAVREKLSPTATHVILHDGARPAVPCSDIDALFEAAESHEAVVLTTPLRAGLIEVDEGGHPLAVQSAERFASLLTPCAFSRAMIDEMCKAKSLPHASKLKLLNGSPLNVRVGGSGDASLVKAMLNLLPRKKVSASSPFEEAQW